MPSPSFQHGRGRGSDSTNAKEDVVRVSAERVVLPASTPGVFSSTAAVESAGGGLRIGGGAAPAARSVVDARGGLGFGGTAAHRVGVDLATAGGLSIGGSFRFPMLVYRIFTNDGAGGPIDYSSYFAEVDSTSWTSGPLSTPSHHRFGVRAYDPDSGLMEENLDATASLVLDADGRDVTLTPAAPIGLRAIPRSGGRVRVEWAVAGDPSPGRRPTHFHVYIGSTHPPIFTTPAATVDALAVRNGAFGVDLGGLTGGLAYWVVVRAVSPAGEESNTTAVPFQADAEAPDQPDGLTAGPSAVSI